MNWIFIFTLVFSHFAQAKSLEPAELDVAHQRCRVFAMRHFTSEKSDEIPDKVRVRDGNPLQDPSTIKVYLDVSTVADGTIVSRSYGYECFICPDRNQFLKVVPYGPNSLLDCARD